VSRAGIQRLLPLLEAEASNFSRKLLNGGQDYEGTLRAWSLAVPLIVTNGSRLDDQPAGYAEQFYHVQEAVLKLMVPGAVPPVDIFPILKYVPEFLAPWRKAALHARMGLLSDVHKYIEGGRKQLRQVQQDPASVGFESLVTKLLHEQSEADDKTEHFTDLELAFIGQGAVGAAVDTTSAAFKSLLVILAAHPEVLAKVHQELDRVAGDKPPRAEQIGELEYLKACISEVSLLIPSPLAMEHGYSHKPRLFAGGRSPQVPFPIVSFRTIVSATTISPKGRCLLLTPGRSTATRKSMTYRMNLSLSGS
jgi:cytochrome P450